MTEAIKMTARDRFDALPYRAQREILDAHSDINVHDDWWDSTWEMFCEDLVDVGIDATNMYFSGFSSQGDGACFEGRIDDWGKFLKVLGYQEDLLLSHANATFSMSFRHSSHYYHENCVQFESSLPLPENNEDEGFAEMFSWYESGGVQEAVLMTLLSQVTADGIEIEAIDYLKGRMRDLYRELEEQYDSLTSDDEILETLDINDMLDDEIDEYLERNEVTEEA